MGAQEKNFWHPAKWKWLIVLGLLSLTLLLWVVPQKLFSRKPKLRPRAMLPPIWDGAYPKLVFKWSVTPSNQLAFTTSISSLPPTRLHPEPLDQIEVDLHSGEFILRQTDFFISDSVPIALIRTYHSWDYEGHAFGMGTNHPYDIVPTGTRNPYTYLDLNLEDGRLIHFERISEGSGYADAVYEHDDTSSEFYGARFTWNGDGWDLRFRDDTLYVFPEAYQAKNFAQAAASKIKDSGHIVQLLRDGAGNLAKIVSPSHHALNFTYDNNARIIKAEDGNGNVRFYAYDSTGHLLRVSDNTKTLYSFEYQLVSISKGYDDHLMTSIKGAAGQTILQNKYVNAQLAEQNFADGQVYDYKYKFDSNKVAETTVKFPDGKQKIFRFTNQGMPIPE